MSFSDKLKHEFKSVLVVTLYFAAWFVALMVLKKLFLEEYDIAFSGVAQAFIGAAIMAKVVLILEKVPLGSWVKQQPAWVDVLVRTLLYIAGVFLVLLAEKLFEQRHEYSSFGASVAGAFESANAATVWAKTLVVGWGLLFFNGFTVISRRLGLKTLIAAFTSPIPEESKAAPQIVAG
jgi:hypothetical protein